jgi:hypothetical protein
VQTNSGDTGNIHLIDPASNTIVGEIKGHPDQPWRRRGAGRPDAATSAAKRNACSAVVNAQTLAIVKKVPLSGRPNNISVGA